MPRTEKRSSDYVFMNCQMGSFVERVPEDTEGAVRRELKKGDHAGSVVYEKYYKDVRGKIIDVRYDDDPYARYIVIIDDGESKFWINFNEGFRETMMFLEALPSIDIGKEVILSVSSNINTGKRYLSIYQEDDATNGELKVGNFYKDFEDNKVVKIKYKYPAVPKENMTKSDWKKYFIDVNDFLRTSTLRWVDTKLKPYVLEHSESLPESNASEPEIFEADDELPF